MSAQAESGKYLTTEELAQLIKYDARTIRNCLMDAVLIEGVHYIRPFGRRKILFIRDAIERDMGAYILDAHEVVAAIPPQHPDAADVQVTTISNPPAAANKVPARRRRSHPAIPMAAGGVCHV